MKHDNISIGMAKRKARKPTITKDTEKPSHCSVTSGKATLHSDSKAV